MARPRKSGKVKDHNDDCEAQRQTARENSVNVVGIKPGANRHEMILSLVKRAQEVDAELDLINKKRKIITDKKTAVIDDAEVIGLNRPAFKAHLKRVTMDEEKRATYLATMNDCARAHGWADGSQGDLFVDPAATQTQPTDDEKRLLGDRLGQYLSWPEPRGGQNQESAVGEKSDEDAALSEQDEPQFKRDFQRELADDQAALDEMLREAGIDPMQEGDDGVLDDSETVEEIEEIEEDEAALERMGVTTINEDA